MKFLKTLIIHALFAVGVCLAVWVSSFYRFPQHVVPIVTLGSGIILGALVRFGGKVIPALGIGLICSHYFLVGYIFWISLWVSTTMLITGWLALCYMRRFVSADLIDQPVHNYLHFYVAAMLVSPLINALLDIPLIWILEIRELVPDIRQFIFSYAFGEALGSLVFAPAIILYGRNYHLKYAYANFLHKRQEKILWCVSAACLIVLTFFIGKYYFFAGLLDAELLLYPMIIWSALRLGVVFTNIAVAFVAYTVFTFHFFGLAGTNSEMGIPEVLGMLLLIVTIAILGQLVAATALERRKKEALLEKIANHDPVTGLPNTRSLYLRLKQLTHKELKNGNQHWLGYVAICNFDALVQGYGIDARNALHQQFSGFLQLEIDPEIGTFRVNGSAYTFLFVNYPKDQAAGIMQELVDKIRQFNFVWQNKPVHINAAVSLVPVNLLSEYLHGPLEHASSLAARAYDQGNIGIVNISNKDNFIKQRETRADWLTRINEALSKNQFMLVAQPIVPIETKLEPLAPLHFELLLRLQGEAGQIVLPEDFIPHAQVFNLMPNIDRWVVEHALQWLTSDKVNLKDVGSCGINLSGQSIADPKFCVDIERLLRQYHVPGNKICFEITETAAIANMNSAASFVLQLQDLGCRVALDDFGSGMASFEYLKKLPVNILKIDGSFVSNMHRSKTDYAIVDAVLRVADSMQLISVAEYVESKDILEFLSKLGVTYAQGYFTGSPAALDKLFAGAKQSDD